MIKIVKNYKNSILFKNEAGYVFCLKFFQNNFFKFQLKKIIFWIFVKFWNGRGTLVTVIVTVIVTVTVTVTVSFEVPNWNGILPT